MTRTYAAKRLLEHGPLTFREFVQITGWPAKVAKNALFALVELGIARYAGHSGGRRIYSLEASE